MPIDVQRLDSFSIGDDPKSVGDSLQDAIEGLTNYFAPQANKYFERYQFIEASQVSGETIDSFVTKFKKLASTCEFGDLEDRLIEQIIVRSNSQELRKKLLQEKKLNLQKVLEIARAIETANYQSNVIVDAQERLMAQIEINGKLTPMQIDTAADVTIISERVAQTIPNLVIRPSDKVLKSYTGTNIEVVGSSQVKVQYKDQEIDYKEVFEDRVGTVKNAQAVLVLKENATPRFSAPRPVPYALKTAVETEIKRLESEGSWEKVDYSDWSTPLVPIVKDNGQVRLCGDYKVTLNPQIASSTTSIAKS
ncbi:uncharacterized protein LOC135226637 [Macrobrachium nipponense]|uniref:uncharacterized protein LOC135226637 n=1 Tax=Macrobrachium nipponense TaxID=159736 RepID=UPI0030C87C4A